MTEFSKKRDTAGKNKSCFLCSKSVKANSGLGDNSFGHYFECRGHGGCGAVICELC